MLEHLLLNALQMYSLKKSRLRRQMATIDMEYRASQRKYRRALKLQNKIVSYIILIINHSTVNRLIWSYPKNNRWWLEIVSSMNKKQFKDNFRVEYDTFLKVVKLIGPYLEKKNTKLRDAIPVHKRIACALYTLGSSSELRTISNLFGIGISTTRLILHEFSNALVNLYFNSFVKFPISNEEIKTTIDDFYIKCGYPMCLGAVDGTHVSVQPPAGCETDYFNYKKFHSIIMLGVVNSSLKFTYINVGAPGRCNDASVFSQSGLAELITHECYAGHFMIVNNIRIQSHLIADSAFGLSRTLLKPYPQRPNIPNAQKVFNYRLSRCRGSVERAFGLLKNRFRSLHKKMEYNLDLTTTMIQAAVVLHNICIEDNDIGDSDWDITQPTYKKPSSNRQSTGGNETREALALFFLQNPL